MSTIAATIALLVVQTDAAAATGFRAPVRPVVLMDPPVSGRLSDIELRVAVENALVWNPWVELSGIEVTTRGGVVTLQGTVATITARRAATQAARDAGALGVRNLLRVAGPFTGP